MCTHACVWMHVYIHIICMCMRMHLHVSVCICIRFETGLGHPGHILSGSSGSDPLYKLSRSVPDSTLRVLMMASGSGDDGSVFSKMF